MEVSVGVEMEVSEVAEVVVTRVVGVVVPCVRLGSHREGPDAR